MLAAVRGRGDHVLTDGKIFYLLWIKKHGVVQNGIAWSAHLETQ